MNKFKKPAITVLISAVVIYLFSLFVPSNVVLGNHWLSGIFASLWVGILLLITKLIPNQGVGYLKFQLPDKYKKLVMSAGLTTVLLWIFARIPGITGFGISRFYWAIILGATIATVNWMVESFTKK